MSDVDTQEPVAPQEDTPATRLADAIAKNMPGDGVVYPETDPMRALLSGGAPAGNADDLPVGVEEIKAAAQDYMEEYWYGPTRNEKGTEQGVGARDFRFELGEGTGTRTTADDEDLA